MKILLTISLFLGLPQRLVHSGIAIVFFGQFKDKEFRDELFMSAYNWPFEIYHFNFTWSALVNMILPLWSLDPYWILLDLFTMVLLHFSLKK